MNLCNIEPVLKFNISPYTSYTSKEIRHATTQMTEWLIHTFEFICIISCTTRRDNFPSIILCFFQFLLRNILLTI